MDLPYRFPTTGQPGGPGGSLVFLVVRTLYITNKDTAAVAMTTVVWLSLKKFPWPESISLLLIVQLHFLEIPSPEINGCLIAYACLNFQQNSGRLQFFRQLPSRACKHALDFLHFGTDFPTLLIVDTLFMASLFLQNKTQNLFRGGWIGVCALMQIRNNAHNPTVISSQCIGQ